MTQTYVNTIYRAGLIAEPSRARKGYHTCRHCKERIHRGETYYSVTIGGGGLASIKFPDRLHWDCLEGYMQEQERARAIWRQVCQEVRA